MDAVDTAEADETDVAIATNNTDKVDGENKEDLPTQPMMSMGPTRPMNLTINLVGPTCPFATIWNTLHELFSLRTDTSIN